METILGTPPPPPPPSANLLEESQEAQESGNMRQRMAAHTKDPICASCHKQMDPLGFAFENYDAIGRWRDKDGRFDIDPAGKLPNGKAFKGPADLKKILKADKGLFVKCLSERMLTYALGRGLEYYDVCAVEDIVADMHKNNSRFSALVFAIVKSDAFQKRRARRPQVSQGDLDE